MTTTTNWPGGKALIADDNFGPVYKTMTVAAGTDIAAGTIMGRVTASGKLLPYAAGNSDGSQNPVAVLAEDAAAASADADAVAGFAGVYKKDNVIGLDAAAEATLEGRGIYFV